MAILDSRWIDVVAAVVGGLVFGSGVGRLAMGFTVGAAVWTLIGLVLLWWAFADRRRARRQTQDDPPDRSRVIE